MATFALSVPAKYTTLFLKALGEQALLTSLRKIRPVIPDPADPERSRLLLLQSAFDSIDKLPEEAKAHLKQVPGVRFLPFEISLDYDHFTADEVLRRLLPPELEVPSAFETVGHIAHLNLRQHLLPYKILIGQVLLDKNYPHIRTVVNKIGSIGSKFREFQMELLAGDREFLVKNQVEQRCVFSFDYSKVYWNSRLQGEHARLCDHILASGSVVADVMAGVGPFAVPAAKNRNCTVHANDLNPNSFTWLTENAKKNKVGRLVRCYNLDGRDFIRNVLVTQKVDVDHIVMNLPASAVQFLDCFRGIFASFPMASRNMPMIHVYTFSKFKPHPGDGPAAAAAAADAEDEPADAEEMSQHQHLPHSADTFYLQDAKSQVERYLGHTFSAVVSTAAASATSMTEDDTVTVHDVRLVSPRKHMLCVSFRLPIAVAHAQQVSSNAPVQIASQPEQQQQVCAAEGESPDGQGSVPKRQKRTTTSSSPVSASALGSD